MIHSWPLEELRAELTVEARLTGHVEGRVEARVEDVLQILRRRFGAVPEALDTAVRSVSSEARLGELVLTAVDCPGLASFELELGSRD
jgi:hypothetical protein